MEKKVLIEINRINELLGNKYLITEGPGPIDKIIKLIRSGLTTGERESAELLAKKASAELERKIDAEIVQAEKQRLQNLKQELDDLINTGRISAQAETELDNILKSLVSLKTFAEELISQNKLGMGVRNSIEKAKVSLSNGVYDMNEAMRKFDTALSSSRYLQNNPELKQEVLNSIKTELETVKPMTGSGSLVRYTANNLPEANVVITKLTSEYPKLFSKGFFGDYKYKELVTSSLSKVRNDFVGKTEDELKSFIRSEWGLSLIHI